MRFVDSNQFLVAPEAFAAWARDRRRLVMEDFYREQRVRHGVLLDADGGPEGGRWNFDAENRRPPADGLDAPDPWRPQEDDVDAEVRADLDRAGRRAVGRGRAAALRGHPRRGALGPALASSPRAWRASARGRTPWSPGGACSSTRC